MTKKMTKIGVIGTGYWGRNLVRTFATLGVLDTICDADSAALEAVSASYPDIARCASVEELLGDPTIDSIAIATPAATHGALTRGALDAGKHVFVEKPLCLDLTEAHALQEQADQSGRILMVGHLMLYHPAFRALRAAVREGKVGDLRYIYSTRLSLGKIRREENALWSFAPHDISMILALTGRVPTRVVANGEAYLREGVADTTLSHFTFSENLQAHIFVSWLHPYKDHRMVVVGSNGMIVLDDVRPGPEKLMHYSHEIGWDGEIPNIEKADGVPIPYESEEPLMSECRHFLDCVENGKTPESDAEEGIRVLSVLDACQRALTSGKAVEFEADA
jgi:UDP-2-acetamido-3-amino-2,3-dideoxy-glucuronate N-acetyltransferase